MGLLFVITTGLVVFIGILIKLNTKLVVDGIRSIEDSTILLYTYLIAMIISVIVFLILPAEIREKQGYIEFENWARVNQIRYVNGYTNLKVSEKKTYESLLGYEIEYREVLVED